MANNVNNGITGVIDIPGALRSRGAADGSLVGGVVAYAGDIYDTTLGKNQSQINQEFSDSLSSSENANTSRPIKLYLTGNNSEYSVYINYAEGAYEEALGLVFAATCVDEYLLDSDTLEQVAQITNVTSSDDIITITTDNNLGLLEDALYVLLSIEGTGSMDSGSFVDKSENSVIYGNTIFNSEDSEESVLVGSVVSNDGSYSTVVGGANFNNGNDSTIIGNDNTNASTRNTIIGYGNSSSESRDSVLIGDNLNLTNGTGVRLGNYNVETSPDNYFAVSGRMNRVAQNILEQHTDGSLYIKGLGGFNGTNSTTTGIKSLQDVISDIESNSSSSSSSYTHPSTHPASMITYDASTLYESGNVGYAIKALQTAIAGVPTYSAGTGISISNNTISVDATQLSYDDLNGKPDLDPLIATHDDRGVVLSHVNQGAYAIGNQSVAYGHSTNAYGDYAIAGGNGTLAWGDKSVAFGTNTIAWGDNTIASGNGSIAFGTESVALGENAYAKGKASGYFGKGRSVSAYVIDSEVGVANSDPWYTLALDSSANLEAGYPGYEDFRVLPGMYITEYGTEDYPQQPGWLIKNVEYIPLGLEWTCKVYIDDPNDDAPSDPQLLVVRGIVSEGYSYALGRYLFTTNQSEVAVGDCNVSHKSGGSAVSGSGTIFSVGTGILSDNSEYLSESMANPENYLVSNQRFRANALEVLTNGSVYVRGVGGYDGTSISNVSTLLNVITGINTRVTTLENSSSSFSPSSSYITYSEGEGYSLGDTTNASGENSFAEGESTTASGVTSHAEGYSTTALGENSHAEGDTTLAYHYNSHAEGSYTQALGYNSHAEGAGHRMGPLELSTNSEYYYDSTDDVLYIFIDSLSSDSNYLNLPVGTVAAVATEDTKILQYVNDYSYISDKLYFVGPVDYECPVIAIKNIPPHVSVGGTVHSLAPIVDNENYKDGWGYKFTSTIYINFLTGTALGDASHSGGYLTNAVGQKSNTAGIRTVATNDGESSFGRYNVSEDGTIFSIGCGEWDEQTLYLNSHNYGRNESLTGIKAGLNKYTTSKNALMVTDDGDVFIKGIGGYDGMDSTAQGVKSVQQVITELTLQIAALTNNL